MRPAIPTLLLLLAAGCAGTPASGTLQNENRHLHGIVRSQERRIDELTEQRNDLERRNAELEAQAAAGAGTDPLPAAGNGEPGAQARLMLERFKGDSDVDVEQTPAGYRFVLREKVLFGEASADLTDEGRQALQRVADALRGGTSRIRVEGHTDDTPIAKPETKERYPRGNMELSAARALSVWQYLVETGKLEEGRLSVVGYGPHQPRVPNDSDRNRYRNRRVEIRVEEQG